MKKKDKFFLLLYDYLDKSFIVQLHSPNWPWTSSALAFWLFELQVYANTPNDQIVNKFNMTS